MRILPYRKEQFGGLDALWRECFPDDPPRNRADVAVAAKLSVADGLLFVAEDARGRVAGSIMAGYDGHRGWLYAVAVTASMRGTGVGRALVEHACQALAARGCRKVNLQVREGNEQAVAFYRHLSFAIEPRVSMGRTIP